MSRFKVFKTKPFLLCLSSLLFPAACHQNSEVVKIAESDKIEHLAQVADTNLTTSQADTDVFSTSELEEPELEELGLDYHTQSSDEQVKLTFWQRLIQLYALPDIKRRSISQEINWLVENPDYLRRVQQRAAPFFPYILAQIEINQMPGELVLLPIIESAFQAYAHSPKQAAGIWQFIPATGKRYGLVQNWWYDGRMDIQASTQAAMKYLKKLHRQFDHDWLLAIAAYNCGESKVARLRKKNRQLGKSTHFWSLPLPRETRAYVPRLLAISRLFAHPQQYQIERLPVLEQPPLQTVSINKRMDLAIIADRLSMPLHQLYRFNPGYKRWTTGPQRQHTLLLPRDKAELFTATVAERSENELMQVIEYPVAKNETLGNIAQLYGVSSTEIRHFNHLQSTRIRSGSQLQVPIATLMHADYRDAIASASTLVEQAEDKAGIRYTVQRKDTIWDIAKMFSVSINALTEQNRLKNRRKLYPGQKLIIPFTGDNEDGNSLFQYTVQKGDSLSLIAMRFNVKLANLRRWNASNMGRYLKPGQKLLVRLSNSV